MFRAALLQHLHRLCGSDTVSEQALITNGTSLRPKSKRTPQHRDEQAVAVRSNDAFSLELRELAGLKGKRPFYAREREIFLNAYRRSEKESLLLNNIRTQLHRERSRRKIYRFTQRLRTTLAGEEGERQR